MLLRVTSQTLTMNSTLTLAFTLSFVPIPTPTLNPHHWHQCRQEEAEDAEHWVLPQTASAAGAGCIVVVEGDPPPPSPLGRFSFKGFNPATDKLRVRHAGGRRLSCISGRGYVVTCLWRCSAVSGLSSLLLAARGQWRVNTCRPVVCCSAAAGTEVTYSARQHDRAPAVEATRWILATARCLA